jgi:hypothetical protein
LKLRTRIFSTISLLQLQTALACKFSIIMIKANRKSHVARSRRKAHGIWNTHGTRCVNGTRHTAHVTRHLAHGTRHTAHGTRHNAHGFNGTRHMAHGTWHKHTSHGTRHTSHGTRFQRHTAHGTRHTAHGTRFQRHTVSTASTLPT